MPENIKKLSLKHSYLVIESDEVKNICLSVEKEMKEALVNKYPDIYDHQTEQNTNVTPELFEDSSLEEVNKKTKNKDIKKLYRRIARKIHPDKSKYGDADKFSKAAKAYKDDDIGTLLELAGDINIELFDLSDETITILKNSILSLEIEILKMKETVSWAWYHSSSEQEKDNILKIIAKHHGEKNV